MEELSEIAIKPSTAILTFKPRLKRKSSRVSRLIERHMVRAAGIAATSQVPLDWKISLDKLRRKCGQIGIGLCVKEGNDRLSTVLYKRCHLGKI